MGLATLACIVFIPQTLGYYLARFEKRGRKVERAKYWEEDNWVYGFLMLIMLITVLCVVFMLGLIMCIILGIKPL